MNRRNHLRSPFTANIMHHDDSDHTTVSLYNATGRIALLVDYRERCPLRQTGIWNAGLALLVFAVDITTGVILR
jgi:hypothetical protein